jgi:hypothetical protein
LYRGTLPSAIPPHPEQIPNNAKEKPTIAPSGLSFETPSSSSFVSDAHSAHVVSAVQGAPLVSGQSRARGLSISSDTVRVLLPSHHLRSLICNYYVARIHYDGSAGSESSFD